MYWNKTSRYSAVLIQNVQVLHYTGTQRQGTLLYFYIMSSYASVLEQNLQVQCLWSSHVNSSRRLNKPLALKPRDNQFWTLSVDV